MSATALLKLAIISAGMLTSASVAARELRASFDVVITLQTSSKPVQASLLCSNGETVGHVNLAVSVTCPMVRAAGSDLNTGFATSASDSTVLVTF